MIKNNPWFLVNLNGSLNLYSAQIYDADVIIISPNVDITIIAINNKISKFFFFIYIYTPKIIDIQVPIKPIIQNNLMISCSFQPFFSNV